MPDKVSFRTQRLWTHSTHYAAHDPPVAHRTPLRRKFYRYARWSHARGNAGLRPPTIPSPPPTALIRGAGPQEEQQAARQPQRAGSRCRRARQPAAPSPDSGRGPAEDDLVGTLDCRKGPPIATICLELERPALASCPRSPVAMLAYPQQATLLPGPLDTTPVCRAPRRPDPSCNNWDLQDLQ